MANPVHPAVEDFLAQIADPPSTGRRSYGYAASVLSEYTGWPENELAEILITQLSTAQNLAVLQKAMQNREHACYAPFRLKLAVNQDSVTITAAPRPVGSADGKVTVATALSVQSTGDSWNVLNRESTLFNLMDALPAYVVLIDRDHSIKFSNRMARQFFGRNEHKTCHAALYGKDEPCSPCIPFGLFSDNAIKVHEWIFSRRNIAFRAHSYPFVADDGHKYILQIGINITAGLRARHALDLSEQRYRSIAENLTMGLALVDAKLHIVTLNGRMEEWFGPKAAKGLSMEDLLDHACCGDSQMCLFREVIADKGTQEREFRLSLANGEIRSFRMVACPILTRSGLLRAMVILLEDITDRLVMAESMHQIRRLEALGSLAAGVAHEINQPLSALHLYASGMQMLLEQDSETPRETILERLSLILTQADKIRQIISHMRALVLQEENPPLEEVCVGRAVQDAMGLVGVQLQEHGVVVRVEIPGDLPPVSASAVQLEQIMINLLVNAMHALDCTEGRDKLVLVRATVEEKDWVTLQVTDNGPGLGNLHGRVFDPFFTTKDPPLGMGLGLSIVHAFVSSWGGAVRAENNADAPGCTFTLLLPAWKAAEDHVLPSQI